MNYQLVAAIKKSHKLTLETRKKFFSNSSVKQIREWFASNTIDKHFPIEYVSTEIAIITPQGLLMQIRKHDKDSLGLWGGIVKDNEVVAKNAIRKILEETGINATIEDLEFIESVKHAHQYSNGDKAYFNAYRFILKLDHVPALRMNSDSNGFHIISKNSRYEDIARVLGHQQDFVHYLFDLYCR